MTFFISGDDITFSVPRPSMTFGLGHLFIRQGRCTGSMGPLAKQLFLTAEAFLRDGGVARAEPVLSGLRSSSAMAVWPGNPRESAGAGPDCADCSSLAGKTHPLIIAWVLRFLELLFPGSRDFEVPRFFVSRFSGF